METVAKPCSVDGRFGSTATSDTPYSPCCLDQYIDIAGGSHPTVRRQSMRPDHEELNAGRRRQAARAANVR